MKNKLKDLHSYMTYNYFFEQMHPKLIYLVAYFSACPKSKHEEASFKHSAK